MKAVNDVKMNDIIQRLKTGSNVIDVTDQIALSWITDSPGGTKLTYLAANPIEYIYYPSLGIVFFKFEMVYQGSAAAGEGLSFNHIGGYAPKDSTGKFGITSSQADKICASYEKIDADQWVGMRVIKDLESPTGYYDTIYFTGWYFCDGE